MIRDLNNMEYSTFAMRSTTVNQLVLWSVVKKRNSQLEMENIIQRSVAYFLIKMEVAQAFRIVVLHSHIILDVRISNWNENSEEQFMRQ